MQVHPDFVLVQWFVNDVEGTNPVGRPIYRPLLPFPDLNRQLYNSSAFYTLASMWWTRWQANWMGNSYEELPEGAIRRPEGPGRAARSRTRCTRWSRSAGTSACRSASSCSRIRATTLAPDYPLAFLHQRVLDVCADEGLTCLDLRADFAAVADRSRLWVNPLDHHPSARANVIAATRILETFEAAWMTRHHAS